MYVRMHMSMCSLARAYLSWSPTAAINFADNKQIKPKKRQFVSYQAARALWETTLNQNTPLLVQTVTQNVIEMRSSVSDMNVADANEYTLLTLQFLSAVSATDISYSNCPSLLHVRQQVFTNRFLRSSPDCRNITFQQKTNTASLSRNLACREFN